jgi:plastocyanin
MARRAALALVVAAAWVLFGAAAGSAAPVTHQVKIVDFSFSPASLSVQQGDTVVWTNHGSVDHTVTSDNGSFNSGSLSPGQSFSHTFTSSGIVAYHCQFHGAAGGIGMSGRVTVNGAPVPTTVAPTTPPTTAPPATSPAATTAPQTPTTAVASAPATVTPATSAPELVRTGSNDAPLAVVAAALIVTGLAGVSVARSRRRRA